MGNSNSKKKMQEQQKMIDELKSENAKIIRKLENAFKKLSFDIDDKTKVTIEGFKYEIIEKIGQGAFGIVYKAKNNEQTFAIKKILLNDENKDAIFTEKQFVADMRNKFSDSDSLPIVKVYGVEIVDSHTLYYVMEFAQGSLTDFIEKILKLDEKDLLKFIKVIFLFVLKALLFLQSINVTHSDIKPDNFIFLEDPASPFKFNIKLIDFGTIKKINVMASKLVTNSIAGTLVYLAPESFKEIIHKKSDVWSLGIMLYYLIYCDYPGHCHNDNSLYLFALSSYEITLPKCKPIFEEMLEICKKCLIKDTNKRYSAQELYEEIDKNWSFCNAIIPQSYVDTSATKAFAAEYTKIKTKILNSFLSSK